MKSKILFLTFGLVMLLATLFVGVNNADAQTASFPAGCSSALGYSATTGQTCNGRSTATLGPLPGCSTALGYSATTGAPCSGGSVAIFYLAGCTSLYGYSARDGKPCNGTAVASMAGGVFPGFPTTGQGGNALSNILLLLASGLVVTLGLAYLSRPRVS